MKRKFRNAPQYSFPVGNRRSHLNAAAANSVERANRRSVAVALRTGDWEAAMDAGRPQRVVGMAR